MRAALVHVPYVPLGGSERVSLAIMRALVEKGADVEVYTLVPPRLEDVKSMAPEYYDVVRQVRFIKSKPSLTASLLARTGRFSRVRVIYNTASLLRMALASGAEHVIETFACVDLSPITYFHFPLALMEPGSSRLYARLVRWALSRAHRVSRTRIALANSTWTAKGVRRAYGLEATVVYPPVDVESFSEAAKGPHNENLVVTVSRLGPEKRLDFVVDVAARMKDYQFYIVGASERRTQEFIAKVRSRMEALGINNVVILHDLPKERLVELMSTAKAYLHPPYPEHFGIAVAEAVAAGLPPVVYRDGGAWTDIASRLDPQLGYMNVGEAVSALRHAIANREVLAAKGAELARLFTYAEFKTGLLRAIGISG